MVRHFISVFLSRYKKQYMEHTEIEILLVEDNPHDAELTLRALRKSRVANNMMHLKDGAEVIDFLFARGLYEGRDVNNKPKVILLDLKMPKVDGIDVLRAIKESDLTKNIPVVILTSSKEHPDVEKCYTLGANSYIVKPVDFEGFMRAVSELGAYWLLINHPPA